MNAIYVREMCPGFCLQHWAKEVFNLRGKPTGEVASKNFGTGTQLLD